MTARICCQMYANAHFFRPCRRSWGRRTLRSGSFSAELGDQTPLRHSHGGTGIESLHYPRFAARASCSSSRGVVSTRAYCLFHFTSPARTTS